MNIVESELHFTFQSLPSLKKSYLQSILIEEELSSRYIFKQFPKENVKKQFTQIKRMNGFEIKIRDDRLSLGKLSPNISIQNHIIKYDSPFRINNLRFLTHTWNHLLGKGGMQFQTRISSKKLENIQNEEKVGCDVNFDLLLFERADILLQVLRKMKLCLNSANFENSGKLFGVNLDLYVYRGISYELQKGNQLRSITLENIQNFSPLFQNLHKFLSRHKQLKQIQINNFTTYQDRGKEFAKTLVQLVPGMIVFDKNVWGDFTFSKQDGCFQLSQLKLSSENTQLSNNFLENIGYLINLKHLILNFLYSPNIQENTYETLAKVFHQLKTLPNLEGSILKLNYFVNDLSQLGFLLGEFKRIKQFMFILGEYFYQKIDITKFIINALQNENIQIISRLITLNSSRIEDSFSGLQDLKLSLSISPGSNARINLKKLVQRTPKLKLFWLQSYWAQFQENELEEISEQIKKLKKIKNLQFIFDYSQFYNISSVIIFWDNINKCEELDILIFDFRQSCKINKSVMAEKYQLQELKELLKTKNESLQHLNFYFFREIMDKLISLNIIGICSQIYSNCTKLKTSFSSHKLNSKIAQRNGQHVKAIKNLESLELNFQSCSLFDEEFAALMEGLRQCSKLKNLVLSFYQNEIELLQFDTNNFLSECYQLENLQFYINCKKLIIDQASKLCFSIKCLPCLQKLKLGLNKNLETNNILLNKTLGEQIWEKRIVYLRILQNS